MFRQFIGVVGAGREMVRQHPAALVYGLFEAGKQPPAMLAYRTSVQMVPDESPEAKAKLKRALGKEKKVLGTSTFEGAIASTPIAANGVVYVATEKTLYAISEKK